MPSAPKRLITALIAISMYVAAQNVPVVERTLSNGMRVLLVERHDQPTISAGWIVRAGSANEHTGATGIAHLFEHMMFKGTKTIGTTNAARDAVLNDAQDKLQVEIQRELGILREKQRRGVIKDMSDPKARTPRLEHLLKDFDGLVLEQRSLIVKDELDKIYKQEGAQGMNAYTHQDATFFHINVPANKLELWAWLESDRLNGAVFREFYSERDVVLEERRQRVDATPTGKLMEAFNAMVWQAHPYTWPVIGWVSDISQVTREEALRFWNTYYAPNNITAVLVGDFKTPEAVALMERYFARIPANPAGVPPIITQEPPQPAEQRMVGEADTTPMVVAVFKTVPDVHVDAPALDVLTAVLNGQSGRLYKELVLKQKIATMAQGYGRGQKLAGTFYLFAAPTPDRRPEDVEPLLYAEVERIAKDGVTDQELQKVKNQVQAETFARIETNEGLRDALAESDAAGSYKDFLEAPSRMNAVTKDDVKRVAVTYFKPENRSVLVVHRRASTQEGPLDPELEKLPAEVRPMIQGQIKQLESLDLEKCKEVLGQMEGQVGQVPEQTKPVLVYLINKLRARIQKLETK